MQRFTPGTAVAKLHIPAILLTGIAIVAGMALASGAGPIPDGPARQTWDFEADRTGMIARGFRNEVGRWVVVRDGENLVLAQQASNDDAVFNVALVEGPSARDLDLSVRLRAVAGEVDRGGGLIWRARDAKNYYVARYNPLEDNFRVYKVQDGKRTQLQSAQVPGDEAWHTLRVTMIGDTITGSLDGKRYLEARDATFADAGMVGLWTKADARSSFDDLKLGR
jgi:hypothetical protein